MRSLNPFKWFKGAPETVSKSHHGVSGAQIFASSQSFVTGDGISDREAMRLYRSTSVVSSPINLVADSFATVIPVMIDPSGEIHKEHPALDILKNPSAFESKMSFLQALGRHYLITADAHYVMNGLVGGPPRVLIPLNPVDVDVEAAPDGYPWRYTVTGAKGGGMYMRDTKGFEVSFLAGGLRQLGHIRGYSIQTNGECTEGQSPLMQVSPEARQHIASLSFNLNALENGGSLSLVFTLKGDPAPDVFDAASDELKAKYAGTKNAGQVAVISGDDVGVKEFGAALKDMQYEALTNSSRDSVATAYKVPLTLVNQDASAFNNQDAAQENLWLHAVMPLADVIFGNFSQTILPRFKNLDGWRYWFDEDAVPALAAAKSRVFESRVKAGVETLDELREMIGREKTPGGAEILRPASMVPISEIAQGDDGEPEVMGDGE